MKVCIALLVILSVATSGVFSFSPVLDGNIGAGIGALLGARFGSSIGPSIGRVYGEKLEQDNAKLETVPPNEIVGLGIGGPIGSYLGLAAGSAIGSVVGAKLGSLIGAEIGKFFQENKIDIKPLLPLFREFMAFLADVLEKNPPANAVVQF